MEHKISIARNVTIKLYYEEFTKGGEHSPIKLKEWKEKAMEQVKKDHYFKFCKHLPMCDLAFPDFFKAIHIHYDMNFDLEMLMEKLQILTYNCVSLE